MQSPPSCEHDAMPAKDLNNRTFQSSASFDFPSCPSHRRSTNSPDGACGRRRCEKCSGQIVGRTCIQRTTDVSSHALSLIIGSYSWMRDHTPANTVTSMNAMICRHIYIDICRYIFQIDVHSAQFTGHGAACGGKTTATRATGRKCEISSITTVLSNLLWN